MIITESAAEYHARKAASASLLWNITQECAAYAYARSVFCPEEKRVAEKRKRRDFDLGTVEHLLVLEPAEIDRRVTIVTADNWMSKAAKEYRAQAYMNNRVPILEKDFRTLLAARDAVMNSPAGLWFAEGKCEQTVTWNLGTLIADSQSREDGFTAKFAPIACKARVDCVTSFAGGPLVDLKTASTASPEAFQRACLRDGHHLRAAWYMDGWAASEGERRPYVFVIVSKSEPHLVSCYSLDAQAIEWGRRLYLRALAEVRAGLETGEWREYAVGIESISLPSFAEYRYAELFADEDAP